jgi:hypothetical protein
MSLVPYYIDTPSVFLNNNDQYIRPLTFGSELVTNGDFSSTLTGWTAGSGWAHQASGSDNPYAKATGAMTNSNLTQDLSVTAGNHYQVEFRLVQPTASNYQIQFSLAGYTHHWIGFFEGEKASYYRFIMKAVNSGGSGPSLGVNFKATIASGAVIGLKDVSIKEVLTSGTLISPYGYASFWPRKGSFEAYIEDQSPTSVWIG